MSATIGLTWRDPFWYCVVAAIASTAWLVRSSRLSTWPNAWTEFALPMLFGTAWGSLAGLGILALS